MPNNSLIPQPIRQAEAERKLLLASILKKRRVLEKLVLKTEMLKVKLEMLKEEYMVQIGSLVIKDNSLDLKIIHYRNLLRLIEKGMSYKDAEKELATSFFAEELELEREQEKIREEERVQQKRGTEIAPELLKETKKLWKKLITLFHPDLTQDLQEKKRREEIMKTLNTAYKEGDYDQLIRIERDNSVNNTTPPQKLEDILSSIENEIIIQERIYTQLRESDWYRYSITLTRTKKTISELFSDMESKLLDDIVRKIELVRSLEKELEKAKK